MANTHTNALKKHDLSKASITKSATYKDVQAAASKYFNGEDDYKYYASHIADEGVVPSLYTLKGESKPTIGIGHQVQSETKYMALAKKLQLQKPKNLTTDDALKLFKYDINTRRNDMHEYYKKLNPSIDTGLLDVYLNPRYQFGSSWHTRFDKYIVNGDTEGLFKALDTRANEIKDRAPGVGSRWKRVHERAKKYKADKAQQLRRQMQEVQKKQANRESHPYTTLLHNLFNSGDEANAY